jgi:hypothetical protein
MLIMTWTVDSVVSFFEIVNVIKPSLNRVILHGTQVPTVFPLAQFH